MRDLRRPNAGHVPAKTFEHVPPQLPSWSSALETAFTGAATALADPLISSFIIYTTIETSVICRRYLPEAEGIAGLPYLGIHLGTTANHEWGDVAVAGKPNDDLAADRTRRHDEGEAAALVERRDPPVCRQRCRHLPATPISRRDS